MIADLAMSPSAPSNPSVAAADPWARRRKPPRDDDKSLTSEAHRWLHRVPSGLHPKRLARAYPRIVNRLADAWGDVIDTEELFEDLLQDRRGSRQGFPQVIRTELERLRHLHRNRQRVGLFVVRRR
jgi:hypothetical protein